MHFELGGVLRLSDCCSREAEERTRLAMSVGGQMRKPTNALGGRYAETTPGQAHRDF